MTASVTACSTCRRVFTSRNATRAESASTTNSTVPAERYRTGSSRRAGRVEECGAHLRRRGSAPASPRPPSGGAAAWSSRGRRARRRAAVAVAEHLHLDVARAGARAARGRRARSRTRCSPGAWPVERSRAVGRVRHTQHADPAAAGGRLHQHRVARRAGAARSPRRRRRPRSPGQERHPAAAASLRGAECLAPKPADLLGRRSDEREAGGLDRARRTRRARRGTRSRGGPRRRRRSSAASSRSVPVEVAGPRGAGPMRIASSAMPHVRRGAVGVGEHRDRSRCRAGRACA